MLELSGHVSVDDLQKSIAFIKTDSQQQRRYAFLNLLKTIVITALAFVFINNFLSDSLYGSYIDEANTWLFTLSGLLFLLSIIWAVIWAKRDGMASWLKQCSGDFTWQINGEGISLYAKNASNFFAWSQIIALVESTDAWHFYLRRNLAVSIPKVVIQNPLQFTSNVTSYWRKHPDNAGLTLPNNLTQGLAQKSFWSDLSSNLLGGLQLAFFVKTNPLVFKVRTSQWLALVALDILLVAFFDYCMAGSKPLFNIYGLAYYSANYLLLLLAGMYICHAVAAKHWFARLMVMLLAVTFAIELMYLPIRSVLIVQKGYGNIWLDWFVWGAYIVWMLLVVARTIRLLFNYPLPTISYLTTVYSFFVFALSGILINQPFFNKNYEDEYAEYKGSEIDIETTYYNQERLVSKALSEIKLERAGVADLYFIGLAGASYQDVFMRDVSAAKHILDKYFDTDHRSLLLVNHQKTINKLPLANLPNLRASLDGLAKKMNKDEDVLLLFLSSHGTAPNKHHKDYEISTDFYPIEPNNIEAKKLKSALDQSGIKNRIVIISACYSGGFIDELKDENSLILTASRKDRNSFGCSNEDQYTYFGDAYFVQSLTATAKAGRYGISQAFDEAKKIIGKKEAELKGHTLPSEPQRYVGSAITEKLNALASRLREAKLQNPVN